MPIITMHIRSVGRNRGYRLALQQVPHMVRIVNVMFRKATCRPQRAGCSLGGPANAPERSSVGLERTFVPLLTTPRAAGILSVTVQELLGHKDFKTEWPTGPVLNQGPNGVRSLMHEISGESCADQYEARDGRTRLDFFFGPSQERAENIRFCGCRVI